MPTSRRPRASSWSPAGPRTTRSSTAGTRPDCPVRSCRGSAWFPPPARRVLGVQVLGEAARHGCHRRLRCHRALSRTAGTVVRLAHELAPARAGKIAKRTDSGVVTGHVLRPVRTSRKCGKALSAKRLAIRPGRPGPRRRTAGGAGATPPKSALACAGGPFEEVAPRILPCRKAKCTGGPRVWTPGAEGGENAPKGAVGQADEGDQLRMSDNRLCRAPCHPETQESVRGELTRL